MGRAIAPSRQPISAFESRLRTLLDRVAQGSVSLDDAIESLRDLPFVDLQFAKVDHHRELRQGVCEIVYAQGKTPGELKTIVDSLLHGNDGPVLLTRANSEQIATVRQLAAASGYPVREATRSGSVAILRNVPDPRGVVAIVTGGTADLPVAEEASLTAIVMGADVELHADAGVAGLHRLGALRSRLQEADALVVVAGMEGALASVVGGLVPCPIIACPTSVGYGATFGGLAALLAMLSSCAPGVVCVNIDDGVGAGYAAALIARRSRA